MSDVTRIELLEASGPVSPRFSYETRITITCDGAMRDHRDATGEHHDERAVDRAAFEKLVEELRAVLPLDLTATKRDRKGISFNHVTLVIGETSTRLDYVLSDLDEDDGDPRARAVVASVKKQAEPNERLVNGR